MTQRPTREKNIHRKKGPTLFKQRNDQYSVKCHTKIAPDCLLWGEYCDSKVEAQEWVEKECWICIQCNAHFMRNLAKNRLIKGQGEPPDDDLYVGINTI
jgi:hypothetical protein